MKKKSVALILAIFGGVLGLHKFYLKEPMAGVVYLFLTYIFFGFRFPITFFLSLIDAFRIMSMSKEDFDLKYNRNKVESPTYRSRHSGKPINRKTQSDRPQYKYQATAARKRKNPFKQSGNEKFEDYDLEEALKDYEQALVISPDDGEIYYKMASISSLLENKDKSYQYLKSAIDNNYPVLKELDTDDNFAFLRIQEDYDKQKQSSFDFKMTNSGQVPEEDLLQDDLLLSQLNKLKTLREKGLLSENEFLLEKEKLFSK